MHRVQHHQSYLFNPKVRLPFLFFQAAKEIERSLYCWTHKKLDRDLSHLELFCKLISALGRLEHKRLRSSTSSELIRAWPQWTSHDQPPHTLDIVGRDHLWERENCGLVARDADLVHPEVRVRRYDRSPRKVDTFSREVAPKTPLLAFEALHEATRVRFPVVLLIFKSEPRLGVDVLCTLDLHTAEQNCLCTSISWKAPIGAGQCRPLGCSKQPCDWVFVI
jgi:hypothetical protein